MYRSMAAMLATARRIPIAATSRHTPRSCRATSERSEPLRTIATPSLPETLAVRSTTPVFSGFTITGANSINDGGGMYLDFGNPSIINCTFIANATTAGGGGIYSYLSIPQITDCYFLGNFANSSGGGIYIWGSMPSQPVLVTNCIFVGNQANGGSGLYDTTGTVNITNCTFSQNQGYTVANNSGLLSVWNCIFWNTSSVPLYQISPDTGTTVAYSDVQGINFFGIGDINTDPGFQRSPSPGPDGIWGTADDDYGDLRLRPFRRQSMLVTMPQFRLPRISSATIGFSKDPQD